MAWWELASLSPCHTLTKPRIQSFVPCFVNLKNGIPAFAEVLGGSEILKLAYKELACIGTTIVSIHASATGRRQCSYLDTAECWAHERKGPFLSTGPGTL